MPWAMKNEQDSDRKKERRKTFHVEKQHLLKFVVPSISERDLETAALLEERVSLLFIISILMPCLVHGCQHSFISSLGWTTGSPINGVGTQKPVADW